MPIADLHPPPRNVRTHPAHQVAELAKAIEMFGQTRPVVIDEDNTVWVGNGLVEACKMLGLSEIDAYRITGLSAADKRKLMLSDNRIFALGMDDHDAILDTIRGLGDFEIPGFDADILKNLAFNPAPITGAALGSYGKLSEEAIANAKERASANPPPAGGGEGAAGDQDQGEDEDEDELICPHCGHRFAA